MTANLQVAIVGPDVTLETVNPLEALEMGRAYFSLLSEVAVFYGYPVDMHGLRLVHGSAAFETTIEDVQAGRLANDRCIALVNGIERPPRELRRATDAAREALKKLPVSHGAQVFAFGQPPAALTPFAEETSGRPEGITTLRCAVIVVGGRKPMVRLASKFERDGELFSLSVTENQAQLLAPHLYQGWIDVTFRYRRDADGRIESGVLMGFDGVAVADDALRVWRAWFQATSPEWNDVDDIHRELGRDDED